MVAGKWTPDLRARPDPEHHMRTARLRVLPAVEPGHQVTVAGKGPGWQVREVTQANGRNKERKDWNDWDKVISACRLRRAG